MELPNDLAVRFSELPRDSGRVVWDAPTSGQFAHDLRAYVYQKNGLPKPVGLLDLAIPDDWFFNGGSQTMADIAAFLADIERVCREHGLCLSREDRHGSFLVLPLDEDTLNWLRSAQEVDGAPVKRDQKIEAAALTIADLIDD